MRCKCLSCQNYKREGIKAMCVEYPLIEYYGRQLVDPIVKDCMKFKKSAFLEYYDALLKRRNKGKQRNISPNL